MPRTNGTLQSRPETFGGKPTIRDTRLKVETVLLFLADSLSVEQTLYAFPALIPQDIGACLAYATSRLCPPH